MAFQTTAGQLQSWESNPRDHQQGELVADVPAGMDMKVIYRGPNEASGLLTCMPCPRAFGGTLILPHFCLTQFAKLRHFGCNWLRPLFLSAPVAAVIFSCSKY